MPTPPRPSPASGGAALPVSPADPHPRSRVAVLGTELAYVDTGEATRGTAVFLHGNPTSSYLWRNVLPHVRDAGWRCLAPDLPGFGDSGPSGTGGYRFADHSAHLDAWFDALELDRVLLVLHDWGSGLGFWWARRHAERVRGIAYMEAIVGELTWDDWPPAARGIFRAMRSPAGEELVLDRNVFVERILPASVLRGLTEEELAVYRRPFAEPGERRRPVLAWPRELPIEGEPADVVAVVRDYSSWLAAAPVPKLLVDAEPGSILVGRQRAVCRGWPAQTEVTVAGSHFLQEDSPHDIGRAVAEFAGRLLA